MCVYFKKKKRLNVIFYLNPLFHYSYYLFFCLVAIFLVNHFNLFALLLIFFLNSNFKKFLYFLGPKLFKRLTGKSNKATIINSLNQRVLAGTVNAAVRKQVVDVSIFN